MEWWLWLLLGLVLLAFEIVTPGGLVAIFFAAAAMVVGVLAGVGLGGPIWLQWLLFSAGSILSLALFRGPLLARMKPAETGEVDALAGEVAVLLDDLGPNAIGKAELRGSAWSVRNTEGRQLGRGERVRVEQVDGLTLLVRAERSRG
jgi:hypothetical protein